MPSWTTMRDGGNAGTSGGRRAGGASRSTSRPSTGTRRGGRNSLRNGKAARRQGKFPPAPSGGRRAGGCSSPGAPQERPASRDRRPRFLGGRARYTNPIPRSQRRRARNPRRRASRIPPTSMRRRSPVDVRGRTVAGVAGRTDGPSSKISRPTAKTPGRTGSASRSGRPGTSARPKREDASSAAPTPCPHSNVAEDLIGCPRTASRHRCACPLERSKRTIPDSPDAGKRMHGIRPGGSGIPALNSGHAGSPGGVAERFRAFRGFGAFS